MQAKEHRHGASIGIFAGEWVVPRRIGSNPGGSGRTPANFHFIQIFLRRGGDAKNGYERICIVSLKMYMRGTFVTPNRVSLVFRNASAGVRPVLSNAPEFAQSTATLMLALMTSITS